MKQLLLLITTLLCTTICFAQKPTKADVTKSMKADWEKSGEGYGPKETITINDIKFGKSEKATLKHQYEGVPKGALITHAKIDFTHTKYYTDQTQNVRRLMTAWIYKDQFGEWQVMNVFTKYIE